MQNIGNRTPCYLSVWCHKFGFESPAVSKTVEDSIDKKDYNIL